eukprot:scaffold39572_cov68-Phaeocystis_antarctica.AAC.3
MATSPPSLRLCVGVRWERCSRAAAQRFSSLHSRSTPWALSTAASPAVISGPYNLPPSATSVWRGGPSGARAWTAAERRSAAASKHPRPARRVWVATGSSGCCDGRVPVSTA